MVGVGSDDRNRDGEHFSTRISYARKWDSLRFLRFNVGLPIRDKTGLSSRQTGLYCQSIIHAS